MAGYGKCQDNRRSHIPVGTLACGFKAPQSRNMFSPDPIDCVFMHREQTVVWFLHNVRFTLRHIDRRSKQGR
ncbi:Zona pellucida sperm-binding protein 2 [Dissostichus eleginoides]|uniref:Zona pellucida sperm-binding protein 2 n=1 Tax=Dissostichus eleginoides TaxID=100907 RepID=A0AAD9BL73_DISEL|nr:Zona pellucida sperm-binding protein 2 [Dissostichus eleginoides]